MSSPRPLADRPASRAPRAVVAAAAALAIAILAAPACSGGRLVTLGTQPPPPFRFDPPRLVAELSSPEKNDNPTLTADLLEIFFTSDRNGNSDVWSAARASAAQPFGAPVRIDVASLAGFETSSAISPDGLTLWFASDRAGGPGGGAAGDLDVWMSTRASRTATWGTPVGVAALSSPTRDLPRPPAHGALVMPLASERAELGFYRTFFASREGVSAAWDTPRLVPELVRPGLIIVDAFLTDDLLTIFYTAGAPGTGGDLYAARRGSPNEPFSIFEPLADINTTFDDRDPWLSPDGTRFFFSSDRGGVLAIYEAAVRK